MNIVERDKHQIRVYFDDGDHFDTWINGTVEEVVRYYLGTQKSAPMVRVTEAGDGTEHYARACAVVFVCGGRTRWYDSDIGRDHLRRVYRVRAGEGRYKDCTLPIRCTYDHYARGSARPGYHEDFAFYTERDYLEEVTTA